MICFIANTLPSYRESIFKLMDEEWHIDWYASKTYQDIKGLSQDVLENTNYIENKHIVGNWYWQTGVWNLIMDSKYSTYIITGDLYCLSTWLNLILHKCFFKKKKVYLWTHGWYGREKFVKKWLKRFFFGLADKILTYGNYAKNIGIEQGIKEEKIIPIHNSLNHNNQVDIRNTLSKSDIYINHFKNSYPTLIFIGRLTKVKRLDLLLKALFQLKNAEHHYNLILIGSGEDETFLKNLTTDLNLTENIWFYGSCYDERKNAQLIYNADLCVAPGNVGLTAMHTMVYGTPVLTHNDFAWQMPEFEAIIPNRTGLFFKRNNVDSLVYEIQQWFDKNQNNRDAIRKECFREIDLNWTPEYQLTVLKKLIKNP